MASDFGHRYALLYLLGNSDLYLYDRQGREHVRKPKNFRQACHDIIQAGINYRSVGPMEVKRAVEVETEDGVLEVCGLEFRMFDVLWSKLRIARTDRPYVNVWLFATDQKEKHPTDTCGLAALMKPYILAKLRAQKVGADVVIRTIEDNPSDYDAMALYFQRELSDAKKLHAYGTIIGQISAGTPAMVMVFGTQLARRNARLYYLARHGHNTRVMESRHFQNRFLEDARKDILLAVDSLAYDVARGLAARSPFAGRPGLERLLEAGHCMVNFDFDRLEGLAAMPQVASAWPEIKKLARCQPKVRYIVGAELARRFLECGHDMQALVLLVGLADNMLNEVIADMMPGYRNCRRPEDFLQEVRRVFPNQAGGLARKLEADPKIPLRYFKYYFLNELAYKKPEGNEVRRFADFYNEVDELIHKRNETPFAHGTSGVSPKYLRKIERAQDRLRLFLGVMPEEGFFHSHRQALCRMMETD